MEILKKAAGVKLLICDVDGVLTDGKLHYNSRGEAQKIFNVKDGLGIKLLQKIGVSIAIITGRSSKILTNRMQELGVELVFQKQQNKNEAFEKILADLSLKTNEVAYIGDDLPDLPLIRKVGLGVAVADAHAAVIENAHWVTSKKGGEGAVRELSDLIIHAKNQAKTVMELFD